MKREAKAIPTQKTNFLVFLYEDSQAAPGTPSKTAKKSAELEATEAASGEDQPQSNGEAKEAAPAQRNISCLSDANTAGGSAQREVVVSCLPIYF